MKLKRSVNYSQGKTTSVSMETRTIPSPKDASTDKQCFAGYEAAKIARLNLFGCHRTGSEHGLGLNQPTISLMCYPEPIIELASVTTFSQQSRLNGYAGNLKSAQRRSQQPTKSSFMQTPEFQLARVEEFCLP